MSVSVFTLVKESFVALKGKWGRSAWAFFLVNIILGPYVLLTLFIPLGNVAIIWYYATAVSMGFIVYTNLLLGAPQPKLKSFMHGVRFNSLAGVALARMILNVALLWSLSALPGLIRLIVQNGTPVFVWEDNWLSVYFGIHELSLDKLFPSEYKWAIWLLRIPALHLLLAYSFTFRILVDDITIGPLGAMKKSYAMLSRRMKSLLLSLGVVLGAFLVSFLLVLPFAALINWQFDSPYALLTSLGLFMLSFALVAPFVWTFQTKFYQSIKSEFLKSNSTYPIEELL